jgi:acetyl-CoA carboxylase biotin carboxylase subunit
MIRAIDEYHITGITTTLGFGKFVMQHEAFASGNFDTHFVKKYFTPGVLQNNNDSEALIAAIVMEKLLDTHRVKIAEVADGKVSNWVKNRKSHN